MRLNFHPVNLKYLYLLMRMCHLCHQMQYLAQGRVDPLHHQYMKHMSQKKMFPQQNRYYQRHRK